jgi:hypothetical protein
VLPATIVQEDHGLIPRIVVNSIYKGHDAGCSPVFWINVPKDLPQIPVLDQLVDEFPSRHLLRLFGK